MNHKNKKIQVIFIHGLESSGEGFKAKFLREIIPDILTPTFEPFDIKLSIEMLLKRRLEKLYKILELNPFWIIIGSSFGGLMGTIYALSRPEKICRMILLAPYLNEIYLKQTNSKPIEVPIIIIHGKFDTVVDAKITQNIAVKYFNNLEYRIVDDDHFLHSTVQKLDWNNLIKIN